MLAKIAVLVACTIPMSAAYLQEMPGDAPLLVFLHSLVIAGALATSSLPNIEWRPDTASLFAVESFPLPQSAPDRLVADAER